MLSTIAGKHLQRSGQSLVCSSPKYIFRLDKSNPIYASNIFGEVRTIGFVVENQAVHILVLSFGVM